MPVLFEDFIDVHLSTDVPTSTNSSRLQLILKIEEKVLRSEKEFSFRLLRDDDPLFVYGTTIRRSDYENIKREQHLDVEFTAFYKKIIDFINSLDSAPESCLRGNFNLEKTIFRFELVGKMGFKWVTLLSLDLEHLSNSDLTVHLAEQISKLKASLRDAERLRDSLAAERRETADLKACLAHMKKIHAEDLQHVRQEKEEVLAHEAKIQKDLQDEMEELLADKQMLNQEMSMLREEIVDYRKDIDKLQEKLLSSEERVGALNTELYMADERMRKVEEKNAELEDFAAHRGLEMEELNSQLNNFVHDLRELSSENKELKRQKNETQKSLEQWKMKHERAVTVIAKFRKEMKQYGIKDFDDAQQLMKKIEQLETENKDYQIKVDALSVKTVRLEAQVEKLQIELESARKNATEWEKKFDKKDRMLSDLLEIYRSPTIAPIVTADSIHSRFFGWPSLTGELSTPSRNNPDPNNLPQNKSPRTVVPPTVPQTTPP